MWFKGTITSIKNKAKQAIGTDEIVNNFNYIKDAGKVVFSNDEDIKKYVKSNKTVSFKEYMQQNSLNESDLFDIKKHNTISFYIFMTGFICCMLSGMYGIFFQEKFIDKIFQFLPSVSIGLLMLVLMLKAGLICYQIEYRNLIGLKEYLREGSKIFPKIKK